LPQSRHFRVVLTGLLVTGLQASGCVFRLKLSLPSVRGRANGVPTPNGLFVRLTISAAEAPNATHISTSER